MNHPSTAKLVEISNALLTRTKQGSLAWEPTEKPDVFETNFPDYSIRIARRTDPRTDHQTDWASRASVTGGKFYEIEIYDNKGRLIDAATMYKMKHEGIHEAENIAEVLEELHELARRQALGIDNALDELLSRLSSG